MEKIKVTPKEFYELQIWASNIDKEIRSGRSIPDVNLFSNLILRSFSVEYNTNTSAQHPM